MAKQLTLFDEGLESDTRPWQEALPNVSWSYSRRGVLEQCARKYYYEYYGANKRTAREEVGKAALHILKQLQNRHERAGQILHIAIRNYLRAKQRGSGWSPNQLLTWARSTFHKDIVYSQSHPNGNEMPDETYPPTLLAEFHFRNPEANALCAQTGTRLIQALTAFLNDQRYQPFHFAAAQPDTVIEKRFRNLAALPCQVDGQIDLAYQNNGTVTVVDWKLGVEDGVGDDSLQLAVYALWAVEHFGCPPQSIRLCKAHLGSAALTDFSCDKALLSSARVRIIQDAERMLILQPYGESATLEAFTPCCQPAVCRLCSFLPACPEGKEAVHA